jgi:hypothetical protein
MTALALILMLAAAEPAAAAPSLAGDWTIDLSTDPAEPYTRPMILTLKADGTVTGSFYESEIQGGRWKTDRGRTCASFRTTDGVGPYHSSVCLVGDAVQGQTWAEQRNFLFNWNGVRR